MLNGKVVDLTGPRLTERWGVTCTDLGASVIAPNGKLVSAYVQVSKNSFIEIQEANAQRPAGVSHFGLAVDSIDEAVKYFRGNSVTASDPGAPSAFSHARLANATDLNGVRIELAELTPESLQRKAIDNWK